MPSKARPSTRCLVGGRRADAREADGRRILVVDDEHKICAMLEVALCRDGYAVETCPDPAAAIEQFRQHPHDMVITDIRMPGVDGFELIKTVKGIHHGSIVLAMTGHATVDTAVQALREGADDYITKPFEISALRRLVASLLDNQELLVQAQDLAAAEPPKAAPPRQKPFETPAPPPAGVPSTTHQLLDAHQKLERRVAELIQMQEITHTVSGELRLDRLLELCLDAVSGGTGARVVSVLLADPSGESLVVRARHGRNGERAIGERRSVGEGVAGWVAQHRVPLLITNVTEQPGFRAMTRGDGYETSSFMAVPLLHQDRLVGVVCATDRRDGSAFDERDLRLVLGVAPQLAIAIENARLFESVQTNAYKALQTLVDGFESKDGFTRGHSTRVATLSTRLAQELGLSPSEIDTLRQAALLHDIGRLAVSDTIFASRERLSDEEFEAVKEHPARGERVLRAAGCFDAVTPLVRHHHERWDGTGYPDGLKGRAIDPLARILTVADAYDAIVSARPHRPARTPKQAMAELTKCAGTQFDPGLIDAFRRSVAAIS